MQKYPTVIRARLPDWLGTLVHDRADEADRSISAQIRRDLRQKYLQEMDEIEEEDRDLQPA